MKVLRNELKYYITYADYKLITSLLDKTLEKDKNTTKKGGYFIRSLYFDTLENKAFYEKSYGLLHKTKYRMRLYNFDDSKIKFEIKSKRDARFLKETAFIKKEDAVAVIRGNCDVLLKYNNRVLNKIYLAFKKQAYRPVVIVDYFREAYIYDVSNIRITFDHQLSKKTKDFDLFKDISNSKALLKEGHFVMEIKYDYYLPLWLRQALQSIRHAKVGISKFGISRMGAAI